MSPKPLHLAYKDTKHSNQKTHHQQQQQNGVIIRSLTVTELAPNGKLLLSCPTTSEDAFCSQNDAHPLTVNSD